MRIIACCVIGLFYLFIGIGCERTEQGAETYKNKAVETYKKVKEDAKERAQGAKEDAQKVMENKAREVLKTQDQNTDNQQK